ncbi:MAG: hypothetical protein Q7R96_06130 [Nanoarchaeota archaeon]|nr:hypothetical protein [Nanoarchaeota archaeon]
MSRFQKIPETIDNVVLSSVMYAVQGFNWLTGGNQYDLVRVAALSIPAADLLSKDFKMFGADCVVAAGVLLQSILCEIVDNYEREKDAIDYDWCTVKNFHKFGGYMGVTGTAVHSALPDPGLSAACCGFGGLSLFLLSLYDGPGRRQNILSRKLTEIMERNLANASA